MPVICIIWQIPISLQLSDRVLSYLQWIRIKIIYDNDIGFHAIGVLSLLLDDGLVSIGNVGNLPIASVSQIAMEYRVD